MTDNGMTFNLMIAGVGGQGTVLASKLIATAAMKKGYNVRTTETIGMAQRGGSVVSHVRIGDNIFSPLIPLGKAHALIAFEPAEAVRQLPYLCREGSQAACRLVVCNSAVFPSGAGASSYQADAMIDYLKANVQNLFIADGQRLKDEGAGYLQITKALNVAILGAAAQSGMFPFEAELLRDALPEIVPSKFLEMNLKVFELGKKILLRK